MKRKNFTHRWMFLPLCSIMLALMPLNFGMAKNKRNNVQNTTLNPKIVGNWIHEEIYLSGDFSYVQAQTFVIGREGEFLIYEPVNSASSNAGQGFNTNKKIQSEFRIFTRENHMYVIDPSTEKEVYLARYVVDDRHLMLVFEGNSKLILKRI
jgi:hypothetical protein